MTRRWKLAGCTALVTGAGGGIGAGLARRLHAAGARVVLADLDLARVTTIADELGDGRAIALRVDVTDRAEVEAGVAAAVATFGGLDLVVANAGVMAFGSVTSLDPEDFERVIDVNLLGVWRTLRAATPHLEASGGYALIMSSLAAAVHAPLQAHYAASKAGVAALAASLRHELAATRADVGVAHPTFVATAMMEQTHADALGLRLWGGNRGPFAIVPLERALDALMAGIGRRARRIVVPRRLTPVVLAPGVFAPVVSLLMRLYGSRAAVGLAAGERR